MVLVAPGKKKEKELKNWLYAFSKFSTAAVSVSGSPGFVLCYALYLHAVFHNRSVLNQVLRNKNPYRKSIKIIAYVQYIEGMQHQW